jgi:hypothetical protein
MVLFLPREMGWGKGMGLRCDVVWALWCAQRRRKERRAAVNAKRQREGFMVAGTAG